MGRAPSEGGPQARGLRTSFLTASGVVRACNPNGVHPPGCRLRCPDIRCAVHAYAGVDKIHDLGPLSDYEKAGLKAMMPELLASIEKGVQFVKGA